jgi:type I restriction enzyme S subunit
MKSKLSDICSYRKEKIAVAELDRGNYISTENMLPDKNGVTTATSLPTTIQTQKYAKGDILVSNIRPYFKKIWFADKDGGCSNDVLVFKTKDGTDPRYLYYVLANDPFFEYSMATAKGTKMPRGDKKALMEYDVPDYDLKEQNKIAGVLSAIDGKIQLNNKINKNLIQQSQALYSAWFEQFLPFDGSMPSDWRIGTLGDIATIKTNSFNPQKNPGVMLEHYSIPAYDEQHFPFFESSDNVKSNKYILTDNSVLASKLNPDTKRIWRPMCLTGQAVCSTEFIVFEANNSAHRDFLFSIIDSQFFSDWMCAHTTGSTNSRQRTTPSTTLEFKVNVAPDDVIDEFCASVTPMYDLISQNLLENQGLASLRDSLLPKLMSGEIDVSNIEL